MKSTYDVRRPHFMLVLSLACQAKCSYCFGPHRGPVMSEDTLDAALDFMARIVQETGQENVSVTFHGGEPLVAGHELWQKALGGLAARFGVNRCKVALQSNLWLLDDAYCALFQEYKVGIGTSLDGPEPLTDEQRGSGYFARTMAGIRKAESHGLSVGCIATFTPRSLPRWREVFDFFIGERLGFSIHPAVPLLHGLLPQESRLSFKMQPEIQRHHLSPVEYTSLLRKMLDYYIDNRRELSVSSLDQMCQGAGCGDGKVCTFSECLGMFLAIDPGGGIYPCQRFCGKPQYQLGSLTDRPTLEHLFSSPVAQRFAARQERVSDACRDCTHLAYCKGGCPYNAWAEDNDARIRDPYCVSYQETFDYIRKRLLVEMASEENIAAIASRPATGQSHPLLRKGPLTELVREGPHPREVARTARRIVAAVELARGPELASVADRLVAQRVCRTHQSAEASLYGLSRSLHPDKSPLNNLYLHVTWDCQLRCTHCYACAETTASSEHASEPGGDSTSHPAASTAVLPVPALHMLIREAHAVGFRQVIITGGEPLTHPQHRDMLALLTEWRKRLALANDDNSSVRKMNLVLRTNFAMRLDDDDHRRLAAAFDQVVVSVDGSQETHDARRGKGTYAAVVRNLEAYSTLFHQRHGALRSSAELSLACVMRAADIQGEAGDAVRRLARRLGIRRTRFRPLLPLGRAGGWDEPPASEAIGAHDDPFELIENGFHPVATCGLGQNLYVEPSGESFPCYAYHQPHALLGNVLESKLSAVLTSQRFRDLARHTVESNSKCRACDLRYLCGGACRAWGGETCQHNLDAPPPECDGLRIRAGQLLAAANKYLNHQPSSIGGNT